MTTAIDFETYYDSECSVKTLGPDAYTRHPQFDPYLVSMVGDGWSYSGPTKEAPWDKLERKPHLVAHNAAFDSVVFEKAQQMGLIPPYIEPVWSCTANLGVYFQYPRNLKGFTKHSLGKEMSKTIRDGMKGRKFVDLHEKDREDLIQYALHDSELCLELWNKHQKEWPAIEKVLARETMKACQRGVYIDKELLERGLEVFSNKKMEASTKIPWGEPLNSLKKLKEYCQQEDIEVPTSTDQNDEECAAWEARYGQQYPVVAALRDWRKSNRLLRLFETIHNRLRPDGTFPFGLKYYGAATTGRWAGDTGLNMQNLPRGEEFGIDTRALFIPRPGHKFVICDLAQIEPRVLAWLVEDRELLHLVREGTDIYTAHALTTMGVDTVDKATRQLAKIRVLGLGYGCGYKKFRQIALGWGHEMDAVKAKAVVQNYRDTNPKITSFWKSCEQDFRGDVESSLAGVHEILLPSGRSMKYFNIHNRGGSWLASVVRGEPAKHWYGGKLCENIVQATARDVFAECYLRLVEAGYNVLWTIHDEVVVEVQEDDSQARGEIQRLMSITPDWLKGCPVEAEAYEAEKYTK